MIYPVLATIFFLSLVLVLALVIGFIFKPKIWIRNKRSLLAFYFFWFIAYSFFIIFFTGPEDLALYPSQAASPYKLPWQAGDSRFVAQGNNSFTSHRGDHKHAWDFVMPLGEKIRAARAGQVRKIVDYLDGIGFNSNFITIEHENGELSTYSHIKNLGALVKMGDSVKQGQPIALCGMVGQTVFPHVHFYVTKLEGSVSIPVSFSDVPGGVPLAGKFYTSENAF